MSLREPRSPLFAVQARGLGREQSGHPVGPAPDGRGGDERRPGRRHTRPRVLRRYRTGRHYDRRGRGRRHADRQDRPGSRRLRCSPARSTWRCCMHRAERTARNCGVSRTASDKPIDTKAACSSSPALGRALTSPSASNPHSGRDSVTAAATSPGAGQLSAPPDEPPMGASARSNCGFPPGTERRASTCRKSSGPKASGCGFGRNSRCARL